MLTQETRRGVPLLTAPHIAASHGFTGRAGGVSSGLLASLNLGIGRGDDPKNVRENYRRVAAALGFRRDRLVLARQVHGDRAVTVTRDHWGMGLDRPMTLEADILLSRTPGTALAVFGADCATVLLFDPVTGAVAAAHAGWRGTALRVPRRAVEAMTAAFGSRPGDLRAAIGPAIGPCCFETDGDVPAAMLAPDAFGPQAAPYIREAEGGKFRVDLPGLNALALRAAGVAPANIAAAETCTRCHPDRYWSSRCAKTFNGGVRGVQAAIIVAP